MPEIGRIVEIDGITYTIVSVSSDGTRLVLERLCLQLGIRPDDLREHAEVCYELAP